LTSSWSLCKLCSKVSETDKMPSLSSSLRKLRSQTVKDVVVKQNKNGMFVLEFKEAKQKKIKAKKSEDVEMTEEVEEEAVEEEETGEA
jgi:hypothetical protein